MSEEEFWQSQPRKLKALLKVHEEVYSTSRPGSKKSASQLGYIDQVL